MGNYFMPDLIKTYIDELDRDFRTGKATEHSHRPALKRLLESMLDGVQAINEPKHIDCGAPDYIVPRKDLPVGYIDAKDIGKDLNHKEFKVQFDRYKNSLNNLIFTDYLNFLYYRNGELVKETRIGEVKGGKIVYLKNNELEILIRNFGSAKAQKITSPDTLAKIMAAKAKLMAGIIVDILCSDPKKDDTFLEHKKAFGDVLIHDIPTKDFADVYAQTIAYGIFVANLYHTDKKSLRRTNIAELIPKINPFLRKLFNFIAGFDVDDRIRWIVDDLVDAFNTTDIESIKTAFGNDKNKQLSDLVIYFYENFLSAYDKDLRRKRGVWYTPQPVVNFIVRAVDDILKTDFELPKGLADKSKIPVKVVSKETNARDINYTTEIVHKVQILDPAAGTGTFLAETIKQIYRRLEKNRGTWQNYVEDHLIPRLNGFELLMASYAIAHINIGWLLKNETNFEPKTDQRLQIYLTNSLEKGIPPQFTNPFANFLFQEASEASRIKHDTPVMVVLGNPPYNVSSQNSGSWITGLLDDYKKGLNERNIQPLSDDYIKFIRYGHFLVEKNGEGVLAYISNSSFIDGLIHRQMRKSLLETFDKIYILDLHGNANKKETCPDGSKDENVFNIKQGVSINIFVKTGKKSQNAFATVYHCDQYGLREEKFNFLLNNSLQTVSWQQVELVDESLFFVPKNLDFMTEYKKWIGVHDLFPVKTNGVKTHDDTNLVSFLPFNRDNQLYTYRPFDIRYIKYDLKKVLRHRYGVMKHFLNGNNEGLVIARQCASDWRYVLVTENITDLNLTGTAGCFGSGFVFPLYLYPDPDKYVPGETNKPNLDKTIVDEIAHRLGLRYVEEEAARTTKESFAPIDLLDYVYAVLHSPTYREKYKEFLKIDFPRVPYPETPKLFWNLVELGRSLRRLHLMDEETLKKVEKLYENIANFPQTGTAEVKKVQDIDENNRVFINDTQYFDNVPLEAWEFYIGGYRPAQRWLKDRKGHFLSDDDISHYQKIIWILLKTIEIMEEIKAI
jgi:predicted helicase